MAKFNTGDMVVLISGSMRMAVESIDADKVSVVWCHEGRIGRDTFDEKLLNKWEFRGSDDNRSGGRPGGFGGGYRGGDRNDRGGPGGYRGNNDRNDRGGDRDDRDGGGFGGKPGRDDRGGPRGGKTDWDGRPREKKFFRDDD